MARTFLGYHGTSRDKAKKIIKQNRFNISRDSDKQPQYLGDGIYFFQEQVKWAKKWAVERKKFINDYAIIKCDIEADVIFDMEDPDDADVFKDVSNKIIEWYKSEGKPIRIIDGVVFNFIYATGIRQYDVARAICLWQRTDKDKSYFALPELAHTQLCVRHDNCIVTMEEEIV